METEPAFASGARFKAAKALKSLEAFGNSWLLRWRGPVLTDEERAFVDRFPVARLATADAKGAPHVVPICFVVIDDTLYLTIDRKPKGDARGLKRLRNIAENCQVAVVVDRYEDDWTELGWVMLRGPAEILENGTEHDRAQTALKARYLQYRDMPLDGLPVVAVRIERVARWGNLVDPEAPA